MTASAGSLVVGSLSFARRHKREFDAVLTLEDPGARRRLHLRFHRHPHPDQLIVRCEDVDDAATGYAVASAQQVADILAFGRMHIHGRLLIHCLHGVGRSAAAALAILTDRLGDPSLALEALLQMRPVACPNLVIAAHADQLLGLDGALVRTLDTWTAASPTLRRLRAARRDFARDNPGLYAEAAP